MTLCYHCHIDRLKAEPDEYIRFRDSWLKEHLGMDYQWMRDKYRPIVKFTEEFYQLKQESLRYVLNNNYLNEFRQGATFPNGGMK